MLVEEATIYLGQEIVSKLQAAFKLAKSDPDEDDEDCFVELNKLIGQIAEDDYF